MNLETLLECIGDQGVTIIVEVDGDRQENAGRWTFVASGGPFADAGPIRVDARSLGRCLSRGLELMARRGPEWSWLAGIVIE